MLHSSTLKEISTHKAVEENGVIKIYLKGFSIKAKVVNGVYYPEYSCEDELLYTLPTEEEENLLSIFERYEEDNRVNVAELNCI